MSRSRRANAFCVVEATGSSPARAASGRSASHARGRVELGYRPIGRVNESRNHGQNAGALVAGSVIGFEVSINACPLRELVAEADRSRFGGRMGGVRLDARESGFEAGLIGGAVNR